MQAGSPRITSFHCDHHESAFCSAVRRLIVNIKAGWGDVLADSVSIVPNSGIGKDGF